jgi:phosphoribosylformylglycinamidine synthase
MPFTSDCAAGEALSIPVKHTTGRYYAPAEDLERLDAHGQILLKYAHDANPNGSSNDIAGVTNAAGNVFGLMPHPEHAVDALTGSADGLKIFLSMAHAHG